MYLCTHSKEDVKIKLNFNNGFDLPPLLLQNFIVLKEIKMLNLEKFVKLQLAFASGWQEMEGQQESRCTTMNVYMVKQQGRGHP